MAHDTFILSSALMAILFVPAALTLTSRDRQMSDFDSKMWISRVVTERIWDYDITSNKNPLCPQHFNVLRQHQANFTTWALQMLDASDLIPAGFLVGDGYRLGNFDECIHANVPEELAFSPQYCLPSFTIVQETNIQKSAEFSDDWREPVWRRLQAVSRTKVPRNRFSLSFCIPSTCSSDDLQTSLQRLFRELTRPLGYDLNVTVNDLQCTTGKDQPKSIGYAIMRYFLLSATGVLIFCSAADIILAVTKGEKHDINNCSIAKASGIEKWLIPFSMYRNWSQLVASPTSSGDYKILNGIKTVLMTMTIVAHRSMFTAERVALTNWSYFERRFHEFSIFFVGMPIPDIFFSITGFLLCLSMLKQLEKKTFNVSVHAANKLLRVMPPYMFVLACFIFIFPHTGDGPFWKTTTEADIRFCQKNWWMNLLFINNYIKPGKWCLPHSYYIAADIHFFIVGSLIVLSCWRWKSLKWIILGSALVLSALIPLMITYLNRYEGLLKLYPDFAMSPRNHNMLLNVYMKSHNRFGGYITGILGAFWMRYLQERRLKFSKTGAWAGVFIGVAMIATITWVRHLLHLPTTAYNVIAHALFAGLNAQIISAGVIIIVVVQITTDFGALDSLFLTQNFFTLFSRLSFWAFLINMPLIMAMIGSLKTRVHITYEDMIYGGQHWGDVLLTYFLSFYCYLLVDAPISYVRPIILKHLSRKQPHTEKTE
ncbi:nose resistant to fluoxetine protein 6 [Bemisia tabaci]